MRHGEPDPGARPRLEDKDSNQGSQSTQNGVGLAIADVLAPVHLPMRFRLCVECERDVKRRTSGRAEPRGNIKTL
jgi:hypothetical protein